MECIYRLIIRWLCTEVLRKLVARMIFSWDYVWLKLIVTDDQRSHFYWFARRATMFVLMVMLALMCIWHSNWFQSVDKMIIAWILYPFKSIKEKKNTSIYLILFLHNIWTRAVLSLSFRLFMLPYNKQW